MKPISIQKMYQDGKTDYRLRNAIHAILQHPIITEADLTVSATDANSIELVYGNDYCLQTALNGMRSRFDAKVTVNGNVLSIAPTDTEAAEPTDTEHDKLHTIGEIGEDAPVMDFVEDEAEPTDTVAEEPTDTVDEADAEATEQKPKKTKK
jgi:hypothetical protein